MAHCISQRRDAELSTGKTPVSKAAGLSTLDVQGGGESVFLLKGAIGIIAAMKSPILCCAMVLTLSLGALSAIYADSATWNLNPTSNDWNTAANWTPATVPDGPLDVATFAVSNTTGVSLAQQHRG